MAFVSLSRAGLLVAVLLFTVAIVRGQAPRSCLCSHPNCVNETCIPPIDYPGCRLSAEYFNSPNEPPFIYLTHSCWTSDANRLYHQICDTAVPYKIDKLDDLGDAEICCLEGDNCNTRELYNRLTATPTDEISVIAGTVVACIGALIIGLLLLLAIIMSARYIHNVKAKRRPGPDQTVLKEMRSEELVSKSLVMCTQVDELNQNLYFPKISSSQLKMSDTCLGQGEFGMVFKGVLMGWQHVPVQAVAVKKLKDQYVHACDVTLNEIYKMEQLDHSHVMPLLGVCLDLGPSVSIVMPFMVNGSLLDCLKKERNSLELAAKSDIKVLSVTKLMLKISQQIALGMAYLIDQKFIHRDLAARNCMVDSDGNIKVGDFGLAEDIYSVGYYRQDKNSSIKLPFKWMAIESLYDSIFTEKTDVWSYGVTLWEIFECGRMPYPGMDPPSLVRYIREGNRLDKPFNRACTEEIYHIMHTCWLLDPDDRPTFSELSSSVEDMLMSVSGCTELSIALESDTLSEDLADLEIGENIAHGRREESPERTVHKPTAKNNASMTSTLSEPMTENSAPVTSIDRMAENSLYSAYHSLQNYRMERELTVI